MYKKICLESDFLSYIIRASMCKQLTTVIIFSENSKAIVLSGPKDADLMLCRSPSTLYQESGVKYCCCKVGCCWAKCPLGPKPPEDCLKGVENSQWVFNTDKIYWQAVKNFESKGFTFLINNSAALKSSANMINFLQIAREKRYLDMEN